MRYTLLDLSIAIGVSLPATAFANANGPADASKWTQIALSSLVALVLYLLLTPPIYRRFRMRALWLPRCPECRDQNRHYLFAPHFDWPLEVISCPVCDTVIELWYEEPAASRSKAKYRFRLLWPQSFGRWQRLPDNDCVDGAEIEMQESTGLLRGDIVGKCVRQVYREEWFEDDEGYAGSGSYVELENGVTFELQSYAQLGDPLKALSRQEVQLIAEDDRVTEVSVGQRIQEVVAGEYWPGVGVLLENGYIIFTGECDFRRVGTCVADSRSATDFRVEEFAPYWS